MRCVGEAFIGIASKRSRQNRIDCVGIFDERHKLRGANTLEGSNRSVRFERTLTAQHGVEQTANREEVCARVHGLALGLLWRHERKGSFDAARTLVDSIARSGQSKVGQLDFAFAGDEDVSRCDVAVDNLEGGTIHASAAMRVVESTQDFDADVKGRIDRKRSATFQKQPEVTAIDELHDQHVGAGHLDEVIDLNDVPMRQLHSDARFMNEHLPKQRVLSVGGQDSLERNPLPRAFGTDALRQIQLGHAAGTDRIEDGVATQIKRKHESKSILSRDPAFAQALTMLGWLALLVGSWCVVPRLAQAAPRVAVIAPSASPAEFEVAVSELRSSGVEVVAVSIDSLPLDGALAPIKQERERLVDALKKARESFLATRFEEARDRIARAEKSARWIGEPQIANTLAQLAVLAAICGDPNGFRRAARLAKIELDEARWSPDARVGYRRAIVEEGRAVKRSVSFSSEPTVDAVLFVDGTKLDRASSELHLTPGAHWLYALAPAMIPVSVEVAAEAHAVHLRLTELSESERLGVARLRIEAGEAPDASDLAIVSTRYNTDGAMFVQLDADAFAALAGPAFDAARFEAKPSTDRLAKLRELMSKAGEHIHSSCALEHVVPDRSRAGTMLAIRARTGACSSILHGAFRTKPSASFVELRAPFLNGESAIEVKPNLLHSSDHVYALEYFLWGQTPGGRTSVALASAQAPVRVVVDPDRSVKVPWYRKWWVWTLVGTAVATAVVVPSVVLTRPAPPTEVKLVGQGAP